MILTVTEGDMVFVKGLKADTMSQRASQLNNQE